MFFLTYQIKKTIFNTLTKKLNMSKQFDIELSSGIIIRA